MTFEAIEIAPGPAELETLLDEIRRYLEAVELDRREGHEPSWRVEGIAREVSQ
jgi:hypothetical protein